MSEKKITKDMVIADIIQVDENLICLMNLQIDKKTVQAILTVQFFQVKMQKVW